MEFSEWENIETECIFSKPINGAEVISLCDPGENGFYDLAASAFNDLNKAGLKEQLVAFFEFVADNSFSLDNLLL